VVLLAALVLSGYLLYYLVDDRWRQWASLAHWGLGLVLPAAFVVHVVRGRRRSRGRAGAATPQRPHRLPRHTEPRTHRHHAAGRS
jgi:hypothetical protein